MCTTAAARSAQREHDLADSDGVLVGTPGVSSANVCASSDRARLPAPRQTPAHWARSPGSETGWTGCDGIIDNSGARQFVPEKLLCESAKRAECMSPAQVDAVRKIHSPVYNDDGKPFSPRIDPGAIHDLATYPVAFSPTFYEVALQ